MWVCVCVGSALELACSVCMHMQHVKLELTTESRAGNPTPKLQQKAFVATSPPLLLKPSTPGFKGWSADNQAVSMQGHSFQGWGHTGLAKREFGLVTDHIAVFNPPPPILAFHVN